MSSRSKRAQVVNRVHHPQAKIGRHLIVAAASGMQLAADRADDLGQPPLDRRVNVLVARLEFERSRLEFRQHLLQPADERFGFLRRDHARRRNCPRVGDAAANVLPVHPPVKADAVVQRPQIIVARFAEAPTPKVIVTPLEAVTPHNAEADSN